MRKPSKGDSDLEKAIVSAEISTFLKRDDAASTIQTVTAALQNATDIALIERARAFFAMTDPTVYRDRYGVGDVRCFVSNAGDRVYQIPAETLPHHMNWVYLLFSSDDAARILWDVGSGLGRSNDDILLGFEIVARVWGERGANVEVLTDVVISHAHIDHFGGANFFRDRAKVARLSVHELDARVIENFEERTTIASRDIGAFLRRAGVENDRRTGLESLHRMAKTMFRSLKVDRRLRTNDLVAGRYEVVHTIGHCPGHLCLRVGDLMLVADQVLEPITPHISPQSITPYTGLENYIRSLTKLRMTEPVRLALPAHANVITDLPKRIDELIEHHRRRLDSSREALTKPTTIASVAQHMFGERTGYTDLLALLEAGSHVEYLNEMGDVRISNLDTVAVEHDAVVEYVIR